MENLLTDFYKTKIRYVNPEEKFAENFRLQEKEVRRDYNERQEERRQNFNDDNRRRRRPRRGYVRNQDRRHDRYNKYDEDDQRRYY